MRPKRWLALGLALLLAGCAPAARPLTLDTVTAAADARHLALEAVADDPAVFQNLPTRHRLDPQDHNGGPFRRDSALSQAQVREDVEVLFGLIATVHGSYGYLGGDAAFDPVREAMLADLLGQERITAGQFEAAVFKHLGLVLIDGHCQVNGRALNARVVPYFAEESLFFGKDAGGYYRLSDHVYLKSAGAYEPDELLQQGLSSDGSLGYLPVVLAPEDQPPEPLAVAWADGSGGTYPLTTPYRYALSTSQLDNTYTEQKGVPILRVPRMAMSDLEAPYGERMQQLLDWIGRMRQQPVSILDLRGNAGGMLRLAQVIVAAYSGREAEKAFACAVEGAAPAPDDATLNIDAWDIAFSDEGASIAGHFFPVLEEPRTLVLLADKNTVSAGEALCSFALNTRGMRTLLVGSNTAGTLRNNAGQPYVLPHSHLHVTLGSALFLWPGDACGETIGILPDLWVQGNCLEAVLALLEPS